MEAEVPAPVPYGAANIMSAKFRKPCKYRYSTMTAVTVLEYYLAILWVLLWLSSLYCALLRLTWVYCQHRAVLCYTYGTIHFHPAYNISSYPSTFRVHTQEIGMILVVSKIIRLSRSSNAANFLRERHLGNRIILLTTNRI